MKDFQGGGGLEAGIFGPVNDTQTAFAEFLEDLKVGNNFADQGTPTQACMIPTARGTNGATAKYGKESGLSNSRFATVRGMCPAGEACKEGLLGLAVQDLEGLREAGLAHSRLRVRTPGNGSTTFPFDGPTRR